MLSIFRTNKFFANILLLFYVVALWSNLFFLNHEIDHSEGAYFFIKLKQYFDFTSSNSKILAAAMVFLQAVLINYIVSKQRLTEEVTLIPGVIYILLCSLIPEFLDLSPQLIGNFFIILVIYELFETYNKYSCADSIYNIGLWIGLASLFYFSFSIYIILAWLGLGILRVIKIRERLMLLLGFLSSFFLVITYNYWYGNLDDFYQMQFRDSIAFLDFKLVEIRLLSFCLGLFSILIAISIFSLKTYTYRMKIQVQKNISILYMYLAVSILTVLFQKAVNLQHLIVLIPALSILISINFVKMPRHWAEILHLLLLVSVLIWQFLPLLNF